ncbi:ExbD/TolR family protein [Sanguibacteroides justesenii]|uniref:Biopolymer transporter ExbD n=1 Tax=Sanguibacteroides justesenii TaxID=1547597 RepID=A0A0C3RFJ3_9PORP|nr:biopolymer transporter ExbD [Gabonibacter chumensis]KIO44034.1 biopolymer transporter ExbD [Sanguibacteroides justesenii]KIO47306.1 biopolymer transporter ExbD [Sanguibacteroides justesenii]PXZ43928.1 biopolymer transporter ExbD [Sanguibacteroides justesenii]
MSQKIKKKSTLIDMTAMSDVTVLLLTFFMLTSTFIQKEPVKVAPPQSVSEIKIPENNIVSILIESNGKVFMGLDKPQDRMEVLKKMGENYHIAFTDQELKKFSLNTSFGVPIQGMKQFLALSPEEQDKLIMNYGIPCDSTDNQFKTWMQCVREVNKELVIAIKADQSTPYPLIKDIMNTLQDLRENRYNLITNLKNAPEV